MTRLIYILLLITSSAKANVLAGMTAVEINNYQLVGAEYWPFVGEEPFRYPGDVLWGFYPEGVTPEATECAEKSYRVLTEFLHANWEQMQTAVALGATRRFYLWTNDYSEAARNRIPRTPRMWHWNTGPKDYRSGFWKWETVLSQDGLCLLPQAAQIRHELDTAISELSK